MAEILLDFESEKPREACGVFGVYAPGADVLNLAYLGAEALQHRGQDAAGFMLALKELEPIMVGTRDIGLVSEVMSEKVRDGFAGEADIAISHTRYSTTETTGHWSAQPINIQTDQGEFAFAHNGHIELTEEHDYPTDSEWLANEIGEQWRPGEPLEDAIARVAATVDGAYSVVVMTHDKLVGFRDRNGFRPLELGVLKESDGAVIASETAAIKQVGAVHDREILPGEIVTVDENGISSMMFAESEPRTCAFEYIYFARPSSEIGGISVNQARKRMGEMLAQKNQHDADLVMGVPDSGMPAAIGFANASGIGYDIGLEKNRYITRTFIKGSQLMRELAVRLKLNPLIDTIQGKRLVVVDDSIVRGTTSRAMVGMLREAGAEEVHLRISSPPYRWPCYYGMATGDPDELIANNMSHEQIVEYLGVDSLDYLSIEDLQKSIALPAGKLCMACLDGNYPTDVPVALR